MVVLWYRTTTRPHGPTLRWPQHRHEAGHSWMPGQDTRIWRAGPGWHDVAFSPLSVIINKLDQTLRFENAWSSSGGALAFLPSRAGKGQSSQEETWACMRGVREALSQFCMQLFLFVTPNPRKASLKDTSCHKVVLVWGKPNRSTEKNKSLVVA